MFAHDDDQEEFVIGEAALNLAMAGQEINQVSLTRELDLMAGNALSAVRAEEIRRARRLLDSFSPTGSRNEAALTWMMTSNPDDDGKHH